jgi:MFS family permease
MSRSALLMFFIMVIWFVISFVTNLIGPLMPTIISDFHLSLFLAGVLPFSFFIAYGLISIPAGALRRAARASRCSQPSCSISPAASRSASGRCTAWSLPGCSSSVSAWQCCRW